MRSFFWWIQCSVYVLTLKYKNKTPQFNIWFETECRGLKASTVGCRICLVNNYLLSAAPILFLSKTTVGKFRPLVRKSHFLPRTFITAFMPTCKELQHSSFGSVWPSLGSTMVFSFMALFYFVGILKACWMDKSKVFTLKFFGFLSSVHVGFIRQRQ